MIRAILVFWAVFAGSSAVTFVLTRWARRRGTMRGKSVMLAEYDALIASSGVDALRRNPCDTDGCLIRLGTRCAHCGVTLYECELGGGDECDNCGCAEIVQDPPSLPDVSDFPDLEIER